MSVLSLRNISFSYGNTPVLHDLSYDFEKGVMYCVTGKSGAGKTTLLSLLSGLAKPTKGEILYDDNPISSIDTYRFRSRYIGVIFQSFNLITKFTAVENVMLSMDIAGVKDKHKREKAYELLAQVGLDRDEADRRVLMLSGGQQQRVAIARALSYDPDVLLADEPTGNLDGETEEEILQIFRSLADRGKCVIIVSHSPRVAEQCDAQCVLQRYKKSAK